MKFGSQLKANRAPHWKYHFVDYDGLKAHLKSKSHERDFTDQDEADFVKLLNAELEKVKKHKEKREIFYHAVFWPHFCCCSSALAHSLD